MSTHRERPTANSFIEHDEWDGVHVLYERGRGSGHTIRTDDDSDLIDLEDMQ